MRWKDKEVFMTIIVTAGAAARPSSHGRWLASPARCHSFSPPPHFCHPPGQGMCGLPPLEPGAALTC